LDKDGVVSLVIECRVMVGRLVRGVGWGREATNSSRAFMVAH